MIALANPIAVRLGLLWGLFLFTLPPAMAQSPLYASPMGNDSWSGHLSAPNASYTDGPFATIPHALRAARLGKAQGSSLVLRGGRYSLPETLSLGREDSGALNAPLTITALPGETPILSGGERITGWKEVRKGRWEVKLPAVARGEWHFSQLYVNGERRSRPRLTKQGYSYIAETVTPDAAGTGSDSFLYRAGDVDPKWRNRDDIEVLAFHAWTMTRSHIADIDATHRAVRLTSPTPGKKPIYDLARGGRYLIENVREALSDPGEWYLDRKTGVLTYLAKPGEDPNRDVVVAPRLPRLLEMTGASHVVFRGLTFADAAWNSPPTASGFGQAEIGVPPALLLNGCTNCRFEDCTIRNIGGYGIQLGAGTTGCRIEGCTLRDLGAGGVLIGEPQIAADSASRAGSNTVQDCLIAEGGRIHPAAVGIWIGQSPNNVVEHNEITDFYYSGISAGWTWGYKPSDAHGNRIAWNRITRIGQGILSDMGGIYTLGPSPGTVIEHNWIADVTSYDYGGWGIYFDEGSSEILATNNIVWNVKSSPFVLHYGKGNTVRNNIFAGGREGQLMRTQAEDHLACTLESNIFYGNGAPMFGSIWMCDWAPHGLALAKNLYWDADDANGANIRFAAGDTLPAWQAKGFDTGSRVADPLFAAPERGDFTLRPGSPAAEIGFQPFDLTGAGRTKGAPYTDTAPRAFPAGSSADFREDFEELPTGANPQSIYLFTNKASSAATVRVSDEEAVSDRHSLKFTSSPGGSAPLLFYKPRLVGNGVRAEFALWLAPGAEFVHEWRDADSPQHTGPSLKIGADGALTANGVRLTSALPHKTWLRFAIDCPLGPQATGTYDLTIWLPGGAPPLVWKSLPCVGGRSFHALRWWGFTAGASSETSAFYLDDLALMPLYGRALKRSQ